MSKECLRQECLKKFKTAKRIHDIVTNIHDSKIIEKDKKIAIFFPAKDDIDVLELISLYPSKVFCFPRLEKDHIEYFIVNDIDCLVKGPCNMMQPHKNKKYRIDVNEIDAFILPCVGVNKEMYRLGFGKGFYEKVLYEINTKKIGVCYSENINIDFESEVSDIKLDYLFKR